MLRNQRFKQALAEKDNQYQQYKQRVEKNLIDAETRHQHNLQDAIANAQSGCEENDAQMRNKVEEMNEENRELLEVNYDLSIKLVSAKQQIIDMIAAQLSSIHAAPEEEDSPI